tara:strand:- start:739 stop:969 length:231 start_codon:yes stop_codon:yes gene_type:complete
LQLPSGDRSLSSSLRSGELSGDELKDKNIVGSGELSGDELKDKNIVGSGELSGDELGGGDELKDIFFFIKENGEKS